MSRKKKVPAYQFHKGTGQARCRIHGKDFWLGRHGTPESKQRYDQLIADWLAGQVRQQNQPVQPALLVEDVLAQYLEWASRYYRKDGKPTGQVDRIKRAFAVAHAQCGTLAAVAFGPRTLKQVRSAMVTRGWTRNFVNSCVGCLVRAWGWAVSEELVPGTAAHALREVVALRRGEEDVREGRTVQAVPWPTVEVVLPHLRPVLRDLLTVQYLAGMRPVEACHLRGCDIVRDGQVPGGPQFPGVWVYVVPPEANKTFHQGRPRFVFLGPRAQEILQPYLAGRPAEEYLFSPAESRRQHDAERFAARKRRRFPSDEAQVLSRRSANPQRKPRERYDTRALQLAIRRACRKAGVAHFSPNQLRHTRATELNARTNLGTTSAVLGHSSLEVTRTYAAEALGKAAAVMRDVG